MKKLLVLSSILLFLACAEKQVSHTETAKIVIESFYQGDKATLEKHTTADSYANFMTVQDMFAEDGPSNFKVLQETSDASTAWVQFETSYSDDQEIFKLVMVDGQWKVTERDQGEKGPF